MGLDAADVWPVALQTMATRSECRTGIDGLRPFIGHAPPRSIPGLGEVAGSDHVHGTARCARRRQEVCAERELGPRSTRDDDELRMGLDRFAPPHLCDIDANREVCIGATGRGRRDCIDSH